MTYRHIHCRPCGNIATIRVATGEVPIATDLSSGVARIPLAGFPVGWRMYEWWSWGRLVHAEARCPDCPAPLKKDGTQDMNAMEVDRS